MAIANLPTVLIVEILSFCAVQDVVNFGATSKKCNALSKSDQLWKVFLQCYFPKTPVTLRTDEINLHTQGNFLSIFKKEFIEISASKPKNDFVFSLIDFNQSKDEYASEFLESLFLGNSDNGKTLEEVSAACEVKHKIMEKSAENLVLLTEKVKRVRAQGGLEILEEDPSQLLKRAKIIVQG